jgi:intracellular septation protein A
MKKMKGYLIQDLLALALSATGLIVVATIAIYIYGVIETSQRMPLVFAFALVMAFSLTAIFSVCQYIRKNQTEVYAEELVVETCGKVVNL